MLILKFKKFVIYRDIRAINFQNDILQLKGFDLRKLVDWRGFYGNTFQQLLLYIYICVLNKQLFTKRIQCFLYVPYRSWTEQFVCLISLLTVSQRSPLLAKYMYSITVTGHR